MAAPRAISWEPNVWVVGQWVSTGGTNSLDIRPDLSFVWISTARGEYLRGTGRGEIQGDTLVLEGHFWVGTARPERRTLRVVLRREGAILLGEGHTSRTWPITFVRERR